MTSVKDKSSKENNKIEVKKKDIINEIKSKYIIKKIFNYIQDENYIYKIFLYSKKSKARLDLNYAKFKEKYLNKLGFDINSYLCIEKYDCWHEQDLQKKYNKFLNNNKISKEELEKMIFDIYDNKKLNELDEVDPSTIRNYYKEKLIDIDSPLFPIISKSKNFEKIFSIYINEKIIEKYNKKDKIIKLFDDLNNSNINYSSITYYDDQLNYMKDFNIKNIKRLTFNTYPNYRETKYQIVKSIFSINNIENSLFYLKLECNNKKIEFDLFKNINKFKSLKYLFIKGFDFNQNFAFKLDKLRILSLKNCINTKNINLSESSNENLELLDLSENDLTEINLLKNVDFKVLKKLLLDRYYLSDIKALENCNLNKLEKLRLDCNKLSDINVLGKIEFYELKDLNLSNNNISDINVLGNMKSPKLEYLRLSYNKISDINILEKADFKELKLLDFSKNNISDIKVLEKVKFNNLEILGLGDNQISDINVLSKVDFKQLKLLHLSNNNITDINVLGNVIFNKLEKLYLEKNKISNINILGKVNFKKLKELDLCENNISDIKAFKNADFKELKTLNISKNQITTDI